MIIKAFYYLQDDIVGAVRFEATPDHQPVDKKVIYDAAPESWDVCKWDHGNVTPKRKKRKEATQEDVKIQEDIIDAINE